MIGRIGEKAGVVVTPETDDTKAKHATAHDLRRSCSDRMYDAGVPEPTIQAVMRHADPSTTRRHYASTDVQKTAGVLHMYLGTLSQNEAESTNKNGDDLERNSLVRKM